MNSVHDLIRCLLLAAGLSMIIACGDAEHATHEPEVEEHAETNHQGHLMDMEPSGGGPFTDGSLYQIASEWTSQDGDSVLIGDLRGQFVLLAMTYTSCEFSCPLIVADMKKVIDAVPANDRQRVRMVLLSIDPDRDTPAVMKAFAAKTNLAPEQWTLLTGDAGDVMEMAALLGVRYKKLPDAEYAHSNMITLLNTEGEVVHQQIGLSAELTAESIEVLQTMLSDDF